VNDAAFSSDGRRVVTASDDKTALVWDAQTGQPLGPPLQHLGIVGRAAFSPDGRGVVTASGDGTARVWEVSMDERPAEDWVRLTQFFAGAMDRFGAHTVMSPEKMAAEWTYLRAKYPQDFTVTAAQAAAWHRREVAASLGAQNGPAALFHLDQMRALVPPDADAWMARSQAHMLQFDGLAALFCHGQALTLMTPAERLAHHRREAKSLADNRDWLRALDHYDRALALNPRDASLWHDLGSVRAELRQWEPATTAFARAVDLDPMVVAYWDSLVHVRLAAGDWNGYRQDCAAVLTRFGATEHAGTAHSVAWWCALAPDAVADLARAVQLAKKAVALEPDADNLNTLGAVLYRAGRFEDAVRRLYESIGNSDNVGECADWLFLAMAHHKLGHAAEAQQCLAKATAWIDKEGGAQSWRDRVELQTLRREAETLMGGGK
jgi:tetratricopeptide (TPR) repeat protein